MTTQSAGKTVNIFATPGSNVLKLHQPAMARQPADGQTGADVTPSPLKKTPNQQKMSAILAAGRAKYSSQAAGSQHNPPQLRDINLAGKLAALRKDAASKEANKAKMLGWFTNLFKGSKPALKPTRMARPTAARSTSFRRYHPAGTQDVVLRGNRPRLTLDPKIRPANRTVPNRSGTGSSTTSSGGARRRVKGELVSTRPNAASGKARSGPNRGAGAAAQEPGTGFGDSFRKYVGDPFRDYVKNPYMKHVGKYKPIGRTVQGSAVGGGADLIANYFGYDTPFTELGALGGLSSPLLVKYLRRGAMRGSPLATKGLRRYNQIWDDKVSDMGPLKYLNHIVFGDPGKSRAAKTVHKLQQASLLGPLGLFQQASTQKQVPGGMNMADLPGSMNRISQVQEYRVARRLGFDSPEEMYANLDRFRPTVERFKHQRF